MSNLSVKATVFCYFFCTFLDIPQILHVYANTYSRYDVDQLHNDRKHFAFAYS